MLWPSSSLPRGPLHRPPHRLAQSGVRRGAQAAQDDVLGDAQLAGKVERSDVSCEAEAEPTKAARNSSAAPEAKPSLVSIPEFEELHTTAHDAYRAPMGSFFSCR
jgi:hypothetical protein